MSFKPSDANALLESVLFDLQKAIKKRNVKTPEVTIQVIQEHLELATLVLKRTISPSNKRKKGSKLKARKKAKTDDGKDATSSPGVKDPQSCVLA